MPPKKSTSKTSKTSSASTPDLDSKVFSVNNAKLMKVFEKMTKSIESMKKVQDEYNDNYNALANFKDEELNDLDYQLKLKNEECYNHLQDLTKTYNEKKFQLETEYQEKEYTSEQTHQHRMNELQLLFENKQLSNCKQLLEEDGYLVVESRQYKTLQDDLTQLTNGRDDYEKKTTADMHKELNARLKTQELQHQVNSSDMKAKIENQDREITSLRDTIESLKSEIQSQRELTREVAQAGQKSVTQNFGGK